MRRYGKSADIGPSGVVGPSGKVVDNKVRTIKYIKDQEYTFDNGYIMSREKPYLLWVLRDTAGKILSTGQYRNDIAGKFNLDLKIDK